MSDELTIRAALTDKEWAKTHHWIQCYDSWDDEHAKSGVGEISASPTSLTLTSHQCGEFADFSAPTDRHALAALALHGQSFGFTWADAAELFDIARSWDQEAEISEEHSNGAGAREDDRGIWGKNAESCRTRASHARSIASRIAALLPPEIKSG